MFKKYLDQTGIAMAFQVIFAEILDKKIDETKLFAYTAMRLRQIGEDLEKIKIVSMALCLEQEVIVDVSLLSAIQGGIRRGRVKLH
jgi:hypothetical protein